MQCALQLRSVAETGYAIRRGDANSNGYMFQDYIEQRR
jgi:hypothetical protein